METKMLNVVNLNSNDVCKSTSICLFPVYCFMFRPHDTFIVALTRHRL